MCVNFGVNESRSVTVMHALAIPLLVHAHSLHVPGPHLLAAASPQGARPVCKVPTVGRGSPVKARMSSINKDLILGGLGTLGSGVLSGLYFIFSFCVIGALNA